VTHLAGLMEIWKIINSCMYAEQYQERNKICLRGLRCSFPSRTLLHTISNTETLLKVCSKFQIFISYSFLVIAFFIRQCTSCLTFKKSLAISHRRGFKCLAVKVLTSNEAFQTLHTEYMYTVFILYWSIIEQVISMATTSTGSIKCKLLWIKEKLSIRNGVDATSNVCHKKITAEHGISVSALNMVISSRTQHSNSL
jgi:hypothetical protein